MYLTREIKSTFDVGKCCHSWQINITQNIYISSFPDLFAFYLSAKKINNKTDGIIYILIDSSA